LSAGISGAPFLQNHHQVLAILLAADSVWKEADVVGPYSGCRHASWNSFAVPKYWLVRDDAARHGLKNLDGQLSFSDSASAAEVPTS